MRSFLTFIVLFAGLVLAACDDADEPSPSVDLKIVDLTASSDRAAVDKSHDSMPGPDKTPIDYRPYFDFTPPNCPQHTNLVSYVPCLCFGTLVYNIAVQYPECKPPKEIHCCPGAGAPKCE